MDQLKLRLLGEMIEHLDNLQAQDLKDLVDKSKMPQMDDKMPIPDEGELSLDKGSESDGMDSDMDKPKGISIDSVEVLGKPKGEMMNDLASDKGGEPDDSELEELLRRLK